MTSRLIMGAGLLACILGTSAPAMAYIIDPFGDASTTVYIGNSDQISGGGQFAIWKEYVTGSCYVQQIGPADGLAVSDQVMGQGGNDQMLIVGVGVVGVDWCGVSLTPLKYNGHYLDLAGGPGNDTLLSGGDTYMTGYSGDDFLLTWRGQTYLGGDDGNDVLNVFTSQSGGYFDGGIGNDCLGIKASSATQIC